MLILYRSTEISFHAARSYGTRQASKCQRRRAKTGECDNDWWSRMDHSTISLPSVLVHDVLIVYRSPSQWRFGGTVHVRGSFGVTCPLHHRQSPSPHMIRDLGDSVFRRLMTLMPTPSYAPCSPHPSAALGHQPITTDRANHRSVLWAFWSGPTSEYA
jgi:hypothetical protein